MQDDMKYSPQLPSELQQLRQRVADPEADRNVPEHSETSCDENELRHSLALEAGQIGTWDWNLTTGKHTWSKTQERLFGYAPGTYPGTFAAFVGRIHPDDAPGFRDAGNRAQKTGDTFRHEYRVIWPDGSIHWLTSSGRYLFDTRGQPNRVVGVSYDISDRKKTETSLLESEEKIRSILATAPIGIGFAAERILLEVNDAICEMTGYTREELLHKPARIFYSTDEDYEAVGRILYTQAGENGTATVETKWRRKDGTIVDILLNGAAIYPDNISEGITFTAVDITESKGAAEALKISEERYRSLVESSSDWIWEVDTHGRYTHVSSRVKEILGFTPEEVIGRTPFDLMPEEEARRMKDIFSEIVSAQRPFSMLENVNLHRDGRQVVLETGGVPIFGPTGDFMGFRGMDRDITDQKQAEKEKERLKARLRQAQKLEAVGTLAGGIAHDFNNILSPIIGYTEMLMDDIPESSPSRYDLEQVLAASNRAKDLVNQILSFSRMGEEKLLRPIDIGTICKEALKLLRASLPTTIEIHQKIESGTALADATQIHQILVNLCTNASHAIGDKGKIEVTLSRVQLTEEDLEKRLLPTLKPGPYLKLSVADSGEGMDAATVQRIFEPYFTTKEAGKGTGLGLAVVHGIVQRHGGEITVQSRLGAGSVFDVYLPEAAKKPKDPILPSKSLPTGSERILVVDDEAVIVQMTGRMLEQQGYRVTTQTGSQEALRVFSADPQAFDMIITDFTMPYLTGIDLAREIFKIRPGIPVLLCTGYNEKATEAAANDIGITGLVMKPLDRKQLTERVRKTLDDRKA